MSTQKFAELGGSMMITAITGLYTVGGLAVAGFCFHVLHSSRTPLGVIPLVFGVVNLPLFVVWARVTVHEFAGGTDSDAIDSL